MTGTTVVTSVQVLGPALLCAAVQTILLSLPEMRLVPGGARVVVIVGGCWRARLAPLLAQEAGGKGNQPAFALITNGEEGDIVGAICLGINAFIADDDGAATLADGVRAAARGEIFLSPSLQAIVVRQLRQGREPRPPTPPSPGWSALSAREREVVEHAARGLKNAQIAALLHLSEATVKSHLYHASCKLEVRNRSALIHVLPPKSFNERGRK